jgi:hypothetical protein
VVTTIERETRAPRYSENTQLESTELQKVCAEWEEPRHDEFRPRSAWSLLNAFTEILKPRSIAPQALVAQTIRLSGLMLPAVAEAAAAA